MSPTEPIREDDLRHEITLPVLGVPVRLRTDSPEIIAAAERAFGYWRVLEGQPELLSRHRVEGRLVLRAGSEGSERPPVQHRVIDGRRLLVSTQVSECASDDGRRE